MLSLLDKTVQTAKWYGKPLPETVKASVKEMLNGDFVLMFTYPITDSGLYKELKEDYLIRSPVPVLGYQLFRIKKVIEGDTNLEVVAYHISDDIMTRLLSPFRCEQVSCATALSSLVMASKSPLTPFTFTSDISKNRTYTTDKEQTLYSALMDGKHSLIGTWEGELIRDNFMLAVREHRGQDNGVVISTHYNLKKFERSQDSSQLITRIHASSTFREEGHDDEMTLEAVVDSPLINHYPYINEVSYVNNDLKTRQELIEWANNKYRLERIDKPKDAIIIESFELDGQIVHLGDLVSIKSHLHHIDLTKKAVAYDYDPLAECYRTITFDDHVSWSSKSSSGLETLAQSLIEGDKNSRDDAIEIAIENSNRSFEAEFDKRQRVIDDAIEKSQSHGEFYANNIKAGIDAELSTLTQEMKKYETETNREVQRLMTKAGLTTNLANMAIEKANTAQSSASQAIERAEQAKVDAIKEANRISLAERKQTDSRIADAKTQVLTDASHLVELVKTTLGGQLNSVISSINQTNDAIKLLASQTSLDHLTGRVRNNESNLQTQAEQISQRVKTTDFEQAKQRISSSETSLIQLGNRIRTEISEVKGRLPVSLDTVNLITGTATEFVMGYGISNTKWNINEKKTVLNLNEAGIDKSKRNEILPQNDRFFNFTPQKGTQYTQSLFIDTDSRFLGDNGLQWSWFTYRGHQIVPGHIRKLGENTYQIWSTMTWSLSNERLRAFDLMNLHLVLDFRNSGSYLKFYHPKLTMGSFPSDWSLSPSDISDEFSEVKTVISQTASGVEQLSTRVTESNGKISQSEAQIHRLVSDVSSKISQTDFNTLKQKVESQTTSIYQTNQAVLLKADRTDLNNVRTSLSDALNKANLQSALINQTRAELKVAYDNIAQKITQTDFNRLSNRLANAETSIQTQAGQISQRLTSAQVESVLSTKGYQTKTQVDGNIIARGYINSSALVPYATRTVLENKVKETTDSFSRMIN